MSEETFFATLRDNLPRYTLTISRSAIVPSEPYCVELFARSQSYRCKGFTPAECFESILRTLGITPRGETAILSDARSKQNENVIKHLRDHGPEYP